VSVAEKRRWKGFQKIREDLSQRYRNKTSKRGEDHGARKNERKGPSRLAIGGNDQQPRTPRRGCWGEESYTHLHFWGRAPHIIRRIKERGKVIFRKSVAKEREGNGKDYKRIDGKTVNER